MADTLSKSARRALMSRIGTKNTRPEIIVRSFIHRLGLRFRLHDASLPGHPDIVLRRHRTVVLVHGCFWHRHRGCRLAYIPKTRFEFWNRKFAENVHRDRLNLQRLRRLGWKVIVIWECQTRSPIALQKSLEHSFKRLRQRSGRSETRHPLT